MAVLIYNDWFRIRTTTHTHWHVLIKISMENRDDKFLEWDYWSLHWWKKLTLQIHTRCMPKNYMLVLTDWKFQSLTKKGEMEYENVLPKKCCILTFSQWFDPNASHLREKEFLEHTIWGHFFVTVQWGPSFLEVDNWYLNS